MTLSVPLAAARLVPLGGAGTAGAGALGAAGIACIVGIGTLAAVGVMLGSLMLHPDKRGAPENATDTTPRRPRYYCL